MRLLDTQTFRLKEFVGSQIPDYVILSHTWQDEEVTFQDMQDLDQARAKKGFDKILGCCKRARSDGYQWIWIDTCSIDKSSSAELSEAINSMYSWYCNARICYAYLADFPDDCLLVDDEGTVKAQLPRCRWFSRGWTLQELIAPQVVEFYSAGWLEVGTKLSLIDEISRITGVDEGVLRGTRSPLDYNVAYRMSWAAGRETTRIEDRAYSLLGIFQVNMPLIYGEGPRAFRRLQEEIMKTTEDYTIFAWFGPQARHELVDGAQHLGYSHGILASTPDRFDNGQFLAFHGHSYSSLYKSAKGLVLDGRMSSPKREKAWSGPPTLTSRGLLMEIPVWPSTDMVRHICLTGVDTTAGVLLLCIVLSRITPPGPLDHDAPASFRRPKVGSTQGLYFVPLEDLRSRELEHLTICWVPSEPSGEPQTCGSVRSLPVWLSLSMSEGCTVTEYLLPSASELRGQNVFELGRLLRYFRNQTARAVFKVSYSISPDQTVLFTVVFGFVGRRIPLCGVSSVCDESADDESSEVKFALKRTANVGDQIQAHERPEDVAHGQSHLNGSRQTALLEGYSTLLSAMKDRAEESFAGIKVTVAIRRQFGQTNERFNLRIDIQRSGELPINP